MTFASSFRRRAAAPDADRRLRWLAAASVLFLASIVVALYMLYNPSRSIVTPPVAAKAPTQTTATVLSWLESLNPEKGFQIQFGSTCSCPVLESAKLATDVLTQRAVDILGDDLIVTRPGVTVVDPPGQPTGQTASSSINVKIFTKDEKMVSLLEELMRAINKTGRPIAIVIIIVASSNSDTNLEELVGKIELVFVEKSGIDYNTLEPQIDKLELQKKKNNFFMCLTFEAFQNNGASQYINDPSCPFFAGRDDAESSIPERGFQYVFHSSCNRPALDDDKHATDVLTQQAVNILGDDLISLPMVVDPSGQPTKQIASSIITFKPIKGEKANRLFDELGRAIMRTGRPIAVVVTEAEYFDPRLNRTDGKVVMTFIDKSGINYNTLGFNLPFNRFKNTNYKCMVYEIPYGEFTASPLIMDDSCPIDNTNQPTSSVDANSRVSTEASFLSNRP